MSSTTVERNFIMAVHHNLPHWNYYRLLERDLENCFRFVQPCEKHFGVYSDQFARIILMASTEIENVLNSFAFWAQCNPKPSSILAYFPCIAGSFPRFCDMELVMPRYSIGFKPWEGWSTKAAPDWWTLGYNKIKHDRINHVDAPTLIRAVKSVGALLVVLLHFYRRRYGECLMPAEIAPNLMVPWVREDENLGAFIGWDWVLPDEAQQGTDRDFYLHDQQHRL